MELITEFIGEIWDILLEASPYVLLGFFVAGLLKGFMPEDFVARQLGKGRFAPVIKASIFGVPLPLCSCGVIPAAAGLRQQGASKGAATSFMISTPETGVDSMAVTYALLDPVMTIIRPFAAFISAITAGLLVDNLPFTREKKHMQQTLKPLVPQGMGQPLETSPSSCTSGCCTGANHEIGQSSCCESTKGKGIVERFQIGMRFAFGELIADIGKWLMIGIVIAAVISLFLPVSFIEQYVGDGFLAMIIMVMAGIPMYVCATASTPIAAALALKGLSPGAALVFLLAGPATNAATITVVSKTLGKNVAIIYVSSIAVVSVVLGLVVNWIYATLGLSISGWVNTVEAHEHSVFSVISAVVLLSLVAWQMWKKHSHKTHDQVHAHNHG